MSSGKKGTHTFTGLTLHQKIMGSKKEIHSFRANILPKKVWVPKQRYEFQKKGTHTFSGPNIVQKKVWVPKKKELILFRAQDSAKKVWVPKKV